MLGGCTSNIQTGPKPIAFLPFSIAVAPWLLLRSQDKRRLGRLSTGATLVSYNHMVILKVTPALVSET